MGEAKIEKRACDTARSLGWWEMKVVHANKRGIPDRWFIRNGLLKPIEFKDVGETPTPQQWLRIGELRAQGIDAWWADSVGRVLQILNREFDPNLTVPLDNGTAPSWEGL